LKSIGSFWPYATTLFDYIRRAMPLTAPQSLSAEQVYALSAYLLFINGIIDESQNLDARSLPLIRMPNRQGFKPVIDALPD
jgi:cytochrome c